MVPGNVSIPLLNPELFIALRFPLFTLIVPPFLNLPDGAFALTFPPFRFIWPFMRFENIESLLTFMVPPVPPS